MTITKTAFFIIDNDEYIEFFETEERARYRLEQASSGDQRNAFRIDWDKNGVATPTRLEPPKPEYFARRTRPGSEYYWPLAKIFPLTAEELVDVYEKDADGNLMRLNDADKAKAIEAWKAGQL